MQIVLARCNAHKSEDCNVYLQFANIELYNKFIELVTIFGSTDEPDGLEHASSWQVADGSVLGDDWMLDDALNNTWPFFTRIDELPDNFIDVDDLFDFITARSFHYFYPEEGRKYNSDTN
jgi:hypothetical protein